MKRAYLLDPFAGHSQNASFGAILSAYAMGLLLLPTWPLPNRWLDTHTLNGASWTLLQEYLANLAYALFVRKLATRAIGIMERCLRSTVRAAALPMHRCRGAPIPMPGTACLDRDSGHDRDRTGALRIACRLRQLRPLGRADPQPPTPADSLIYEDQRCAASGC